MTETASPRETLALIDLVNWVQPPDNGVGADLGAYSGWWARSIESRWGCRMFPLDIARSPLVGGVDAGCAPINADIQHLPVASSSLDLVWCRDTLSMVPDVHLAIREIARVLKAGAGAVLYTATVTPKMGARDLAELVEALDMPRWWSNGRAPIDQAVLISGLRVLQEERFSPEFQEAALERADEDLLYDLRLRARFEREAETLRTRIGPRWCNRFRAWSDWPLYLLLGKLETHAWVVAR